MRFKASRFLNYKATPKAIKAYLLDVGVPEEDIDLIDLEALADPTITVKELLPSLEKEYPLLGIYITEEKTEEEYQQEYIDFLKRILQDIETYGDELGTTNLYIAIDHIYNSELIPDEELFKIIDDLLIDPNQLSKKVREAYLRWKYNLPRIAEIYEKPLSPYLKEMVELAKKNQDLFYLDIGKLPKTITKETAIKNLPTILVLGTDKELKELENLANKYPEVFDWLYNEFPRAVELLKEAKKTKIEQIFALPDIDYQTLKKMFPKTIKALEKIYKPVWIKTEKELAKRVEVKPKKEEKPQPKPAPAPIGYLIPKPKRHRLYWKGTPVGEEDRGVELTPYGEIVKQIYLNRLLKQYSKSDVEKAIAYVESKYPWLNPNTPNFWNTVEATLRYKRWKEDEFFSKFRL